MNRRELLKSAGLFVSGAVTDHLLLPRVNTEINEDPNERLNKAGLTNWLPVYNQISKLREMYGSDPFQTTSEILIGVTEGRIDSSDSHVQTLHEGWYEGDCVGQKQHAVELAQERASQFNITGENIQEVKYVLEKFAKLFPLFIIASPIEVEVSNNPYFLTAGGYFQPNKIGFISTETFGTDYAYEIYYHELKHAFMYPFLSFDKEYLSRIKPAMTEKQAASFMKHEAEGISKILDTWIQLPWEIAEYSNRGIPLLIDKLELADGEIDEYKAAFPLSNEPDIPEYFSNTQNQIDRFYYNAILHHVGINLDLYKDHPLFPKLMRKTIEETWHSFLISPPQSRNSHYPKTPNLQII